MSPARSAERQIYVAIDVNLDGERDVLRLWVTPGGEGAKCWGNVLGELRNGGIHDTLIVCCDGAQRVAECDPSDVAARGCPTLRRASRALSDQVTSKKYWAQVCREMREIHTTPSLEAAKAVSWGSPTRGGTGIRR